jgi:hypothetical protein
VAIDASVKERVTIYTAPGAPLTAARLSLGPLLTRRAVGAQLAWQF